ncbi:hypothetical protein GF380_02945 [Candidatus Uhrbacteria bacterium]|nr:hypothetical protein [Candidatus Uhrbacteria bacterium]MBD3284106.1 hypothetical protein [Candidatus Uhrbacteria bacterium]
MIDHTQWERYQDLERDLTRAGVPVSGHFQLSSQLHSDLYFEKYVIIRNPALLARVADAMVCWIIQSVPDMERIDGIVSPETGGPYFGHAVTERLMQLQQVQWDDPNHLLFLNAVKTHNGFEFRRCCDEKMKKGQPDLLKERIEERAFLIIDDVLTTGKTILALKQLIQAYNGTVLGALTLYDRGLPKDALTDVPRLGSLINVRAEHWTADECPECEADEQTAVRPAMPAYRSDLPPESFRRVSEIPHEDVGLPVVRNDTDDRLTGISGEVATSRHDTLHDDLGPPRSSRRN